jgi:hypothetical protein
MPLDLAPAIRRVSRPVPDSQLRTHSAYSCPDREAYALEHGVTPFLVESDEQMKIRAQALIEKDWSTLDQKEAIKLRTRMDDLCEYLSVKLEDDSPVFFDPSTREFYAFPRKS